MPIRVFFSLCLVTLLALFSGACTSDNPSSPPTTASQAATNASPAEQGDLPTYRIGYMICNSRQETLRRFLPFSKFLGEKLGVRFETEAIDTIDFTRRVKDLHFTHTNSLLYVILHRLHGVEVLAAEKKDSLGHLSQGVIVTQKDSAIRAVADLRGKTMLFGPMLAPTGFMAQVDLLLKAGLDPDQDLALYTIPAGSFKHEKVAYGVLFGAYDAGALPIADVENMIAQGRLAEDDLRIIAKAEPIPYCNFGFTQRVDEAFARRFRQAVLAITPEDTVEFEGERIKVLQRALVDGYVAITDKDFDVVRAMAKRTNMPPYQKF